MAILVGIDELNWYGPTTERIVLPLRKHFDKRCAIAYCKDFDEIPFDLRIGDPGDALGPVEPHKPSSCIGIDVLLSFDPYEYPDGYATKIATWIRRAVDELAAHMAQAEYGFAENEFRTECKTALSECERSLEM